MQVDRANGKGVNSCVLFYAWEAGLPESPPTVTAHKHTHIHVIKNAIVQDELAAL